MLIASVCYCYLKGGNAVQLEGLIMCVGIWHHVFSKQQLDFSF